MTLRSKAQGSSRDLAEFLKTLNINASDEDERSVLHWACASGNTEAVKLILSYPDVNLNSQDDSGWTPLMSAVSAGYVDIIQLLLES